MKKRVLIVEPRGVKANVFADYLHLPLMGPLYLGTILQQAGFEVRIINENLLHRDVTLAELDTDFLLLSLLTPTAERGYEIARTFRDLYPGRKIVIGGIHPSFLPEEAAECADHVVVGEGEQVIVDLLRHGGERVVAGPRLRDLDVVPSPDFGLLLGRERLNITPVVTSRGCPYDCNFCAVTEMFGRGYRTHSPARVLEDLERAPTRQIFFYDDNFAANPKRTHALLDEMIRRKMGLKWTAQVRADITRDRELVAKMRRSGCLRVYIGFESIDPATLEGMNKRQSPEDVRAAIEVFHAHQISIHGMFIFGSDEEDAALFRETAAFCRKSRLSSVQFMILTPLPGTGFFKRMEKEGRLLHRMWSFYDGMHAVYRPLNFTPSELQEGTLQAFQDFYSLVAVMNDSLNIVFETARGVTTSLLSGFRVPSLESAFVKLQAKAIIRKWKALNSGYLAYLRGLRPGT